jgi:glycine/D-amino acid oxidase-like deaminating enzyme
MQNLSYWEKTHFLKADVVIIGAGIVGLNAAIALKKANTTLSVLVLERGFLPSGASTKNAGFACFGSISELIEQEKLSGTEALKQLVAKRWKGLLKLRELLGDDQIDFQNHGGYELFRVNEQDLANQCLDKLAYFNDLLAEVVGQKNVYTESSSKINDFGFKGISTLLKNSLEAQIDPGLMMKTLLTKAGSFGVMVLNNCSVNQIIEEENNITLNTNQGHFKCKKVLITTNAFVKELLPDMAVKPGRGQVIVTKPIANLKIKGAFHYDKGYYYFRNINNRILLGGGRNLDFKTEETTAFGETELVQNEFKTLLSQVILPNTPFEIEHKWSGIMAFGPQLAPIIEEVKPSVFCAVRCNGMGIAIGAHTGQDAAEMIYKQL